MKKRNAVTLRTFFAENQLLLLFLSLLLVGVLCGSYLYGDTAMASPVKPVNLTVSSMLQAFGESMLLPGVLLLLLFLAGLTAYGVPITVMVPLFFGLGVGLTQGYYYAMGIAGVGISCLFVLPRGLIAAIGILMACAEALRMSLRLARQLMPGSAMGSMWVPFRLYCIRFLLFLAIALAASVVDVTLRTVFSFWLT